MADSSVHHQDSLHSFGNSYDVFMKYTSLTRSTAECLRRNIPQIIANTVNKESLKKIAVLGVGSFNGEQDLIIIDEIDKSLKEEIPLRYTAVEPCAPALDEFERNAQELFQNNMKRDVTFEKMPVQFGTFMETSKETKAYDFIHFIHCMNYMDVEKVLVHCFNNELKDGGKIMVAISSKGSIFKELTDKFRGKKIPCYFDFYQFYSPDIIKELARKCGWEIEIFPYSFQLDFTECVIGSDEGDLIMEHVVKGDFKQHATPEIREEVKQVLMELCTETNGRFIGNEPCEAIILTKRNVDII